MAGYTIWGENRWRVGNGSGTHSLHCTELARRAREGEARKRSRCTTKKAAALVEVHCTPETFLTDGRTDADGTA